MNAQAILSVPWRANRPATAWLGLVLIVLALLGATGVGIFSHDSDRWVDCTAVVGACEGFLWAFVMSGTVLLAIDARHLRLPALQEGVVRSLWIYGLLSVMLPALLLWACFGHFAAIASMLGLFSVGGFLFALLPRYLSVPFYLLPMTLNASPAWFDVPGLASTHFLVWSAPALLVLVAAAAWRWHQLLRKENPRVAGWFQPMVMQFHGCARRGGWNAWTGFAGSGVDMLQQIRRRPAWMQARANLDSCDRNHPILALRVALGGVFMPLTALGWLRKVALIAVPSLLFMVLITCQHVVRHGLHAWLAVWRDGAMLLLVWFGAFAGMMLTLSSLTQLGQRWSRANAELALLALMPGLSAGMNLKHHLLRAILQPTLRLQALLVVALLALALGMHMTAQATAFVLLSQCGAAGFVIAFSLLILGGRQLGRWSNVALAVLGCVLINVSLFTSTLSDTGTIRLGVISLRTLLFAGWIALALILIHLSRRGWFGLRQRAHPFFPADR